MNYLYFPYFWKQKAKMPMKKSMKPHRKYVDNGFAASSQSSLERELVTGGNCKNPIMANIINVNPQAITLEMNNSDAFIPSPLLNILSFKFKVLWRLVLKQW